MSISTPALCATLLLPLPPRQDPAVLRLHDVRALEAAATPEAPRIDVRLPLASAFLGEFEPDGYEDEPRELSDTVLDRGWAGFLAGALGASRDDGHLRLQHASGFLRLEATPREHARVEAVLGELERHVLRSVDLELWVLAPTAVPAGTPAVLTAAQAAALLADGSAVLERTSARTRAGEALRLGASGARARLYEYDVEVACGAEIWDPAVTVVTEGTEVGVLAAERVGGGYHLRAWGRRVRERGPARTLHLAPFEDTPLQAPHLSSTLAVGSADLEDGGAILLAQDWTPDGVWLVRVRGATPSPPSPPSPNWIPLGGLLALPQLKAPPFLDGPEPSGGLRHDLDDTAAGVLMYRHFSDPAFSQDVLLAALQRERDGAGLEGHLALLHGAVHVTGSDALRERVRARLLALEEELTGSASIEVRLGVVERDSTRTGEDLPHRMTGACRLGDALLLVAGEERLYLKDHDVEIAGSARIPDPEVATIFDGVSLWCRPNRSRDGGLTLGVALDYQELAGEFETLPVIFPPPLETAGAGEDGVKRRTASHRPPFETFVELPHTRRARVQTLIHVQAEGWTELARIGLSGTDRELRAAVRARVD